MSVHIASVDSNRLPHRSMSARHRSPDASGMGCVKRSIDAHNALLIRAVISLSAQRSINAHIAQIVMRTTLAYKPTRFQVIKYRADDTSCHRQPCMHARVA